MSVAKDTIDRLVQAGVPAVTSVLYGLGIMNAFIAGLVPASRERCRFAGTAHTLRCIPMREDIRAAISAKKVPNIHRQALAAARAGDVIITDMGGHTTLSLFGDLMSTHLSNIGVAGLVTDGGISDLPALASVPLPIFCAGSAPVAATSRITVADFGVPIGCRGVPVYPGDIVVGDMSGVTVVPAHLADEVAGKALEKERLEAFLLERLQAGAPLEGTYPPDEATLAAYRARA